MKKILLYSFLLTVFFGAVSCDKESEDVSTVTTYATIEFDEFVVRSLGEAFTPSATAFEGETEVEVVISGSADVNTVGVYIIDYSAVNSDGFSAASSQTVIVYDPSVIPTDVTGAIQDKGRNERKATISLVDGTTNIFFCTDFAFGGTFPMYFTMDGDTMIVIPQNFVFGVTSVDATYDPAAREYAIVVNPQGFAYNFQYQ